MTTEADRAADPAATDAAGGSDPAFSEWRTDHLLAHRSLFRSPFDSVPTELYAQVGSGRAALSREHVALEPWTTVSLNTYFGRFPASYWQRWTEVGSVRVELAVTGSGTITAFASDRYGLSRPLQEVVLRGETNRTVQLDLALDRFLDGGALWLDLSTSGSTLAASTVRWSVPEPPRFVPAAVVICTHNRSAQCLRTLRVLADDAEVLQSLDSVRVIDQGSDLVSQQPDYPAARAALGSKLQYLRQPNLGASGGFGRGLHDLVVQGGPERPSAILIDDEILLEPDVLLRLTAFANSTVETAIVGAQMLELMHPRTLQVSAERAEFATIDPGLPVPNALHKTNLTAPHDHVRVDAEYNAWWCCLIPCEVVDAIGLPLPMFYQWDDVEFGYRARARGYPTVTLDGAGIWHPDFEWKEDDAPVRYFMVRNALIIDALHGDFRPPVNARAVATWISHCLVSMRYGQAETLIKGVEDFLAGPEILRDGGAQALADVAALRAEHPETVHRRAATAPVRSTERPIAPAGHEPSHPGRVLVKRAVYQLLGRVGGNAAIPAADAHWWHVSLFARAVVTSRDQRTVMIREFDRARAMRLARRGAKAVSRLLREGSSVQRRYQAAAPGLSSRENWTRLFGCDAPDMTGTTGD